MKIIMKPDLFCSSGFVYLVIFLALTHCDSIWSVISLSSQRKQVMLIVKNDLIYKMWLLKMLAIGV